MVNARSYISSNFTKSFLTIFLPFFLIISLVYLVKISALTSKIQISFVELLRLFSYSVPDILFYTLPLSFIAALANMLIKLSTDNELIALYALGLNANRILRGLFLVSLLFSFLLLTLSFLAMPMSKQLYKSFKEEKKAEAKLNIVPGKLGQKFGEYYVYIKGKENETFHDLVIYNRTNMDEEQFFASKDGKLNKHNGQTSLLLKDGYGYTYSKERLQQIQYATLEAFDTTKKKRFHFEDIVAYWSKASHDKDIMHRLLFFLFISLIPLLSVYLVAAFTMINPRYQSNHSFIVIFATTLFLYLIASSLDKWGNIPLLIIAILLTLGGGVILFQKRVARYF
ncbi:LptF/LptG family permease [Sulfurovum sp. ST-21]|uniref:LptF/LptG family permease n=1 Tax=Sulfurovum indicum TaxID=2779528 RepID=A0A7M1S4T8_9BACT|nr:LptF/LptG family permease [Sulfurovum indicum]QOR62435.1 LptF/LptG family permease [Sulfurovum indicum]